MSFQVRRPPRSRLSPNVLRRSFAWSRAVLALLFFALLGLQGSPVVAQGADATVVFGIRQDAPPFSYCVARESECPSGICAAKLDLPDCAYADGYTVRICERIREGIAAKDDTISFAYKVVGTGDRPELDRFRMLASGEISILCGASTLTLERMRDFRGSLLTFISGASAIHRSGIDLNSITSLLGLKLGVLTGTTTSAWLYGLNRQLEGKVKLSITELSSHTQVA